MEFQLSLRGAEGQRIACKDCKKQKFNDFMIFQYEKLNLCPNLDSSMHIFAINAYIFNFRLKIVILQYSSSSLRPLQTWSGILVYGQIYSLSLSKFDGNSEKIRQQV